MKKLVLISTYRQWLFEFSRDPIAQLVSLNISMFAEKKEMQKSFLEKISNIILVMKYIQKALSRREKMITKTEFICVFNFKSRFFPALLFSYVSLQNKTLPVTL